MEIEGIVLRATPYKEKDAMINVLTAQGIVSFLARGSLTLNASNAPSLTQYAFSRFDLTEGKAGGKSLKEGTLLKSYENAYRRLDSLAALSLLGELAIHGVGEEEASAVFPYFKAALEAVEAGFDPLTTINIFFAQILKAGGYGLEVGHCVFCDSPKDIVAVSFADGGFVCRNCFDAETMHVDDPRYLKIIRYLFIVGPEDFRRVAFSQEENLRILREFKDNAADQLGLTLKGYDLVLKTVKN